MRIDERLALVASFQFGIGSAYDCHVYALRAPEGVVLIDSGSGLATDSLRREVAREWPGVDIAGVILTHAHPDHACGAATINAPVFSPGVSIDVIRTGDESACGLAEARDRGGYPAEVRLLPCPAALPYSDGRVLTLAGQEFRPIAVRGHSADSHCLLTEVDGKRLLFAGDTIFYGAVFGVINRFDSGMEGYRQDLPKLARLGVDALLPGHGLFPLRNGQRHIDKALQVLEGGFLPRQVGQFDLIF